MNTPIQEKKEPVIGRIALTEHDMRDSLHSNVVGGGSAHWVNSLTKRDLRQMVEEAGCELRDSGALATVLAEVGRRSYRQQLKLNYRAAVATISSPRSSVHDSHGRRS